MKIASCCAVLLLAVGATGSLPVWPAPLYVAGGNSSGKIALSSAFDFAFTGAGTPATIIKGFDRYRALTRPNRAAQTPTADGQLATLSVSTDDASEGVPQHGFDEVNYNNSHLNSILIIYVLGYQRYYILCIERAVD